MKKCLLIICVGFLLLNSFVFTGIAQQTIRMGTQATYYPDNYEFAPARYLASKVEQASHGEYKFEILSGGSIGTGIAVLEQCMNGLIEFGLTMDAHLAYFYPNFQVFALPYVFRNHAVAYDVLDGPFGQEMKEDIIKKTGMRVIAWGENGGFRNFTTSKTKIKSPSDMKGLKIRTMEIPAHMTMVKALGANPVPIAWLELYTSLQTGVADGQENAIPTVIIGKLEEVQNYLVLDGHVFSIEIFLVNEDWFQQQDEELQRVILSTGKVMEAMNRGISRLGELNGIDYLKEKGMEIYQPNSDEYAQFRNLTQEPVLKWMREQDNIDPKWIDGLLKAVEESEKKLGY